MTDTIYDIWVKILVYIIFEKIYVHKILVYLFSIVNIFLKTNSMTNRKYLLPNFCCYAICGCHHFLIRISFNLSISITRLIKKNSNTKRGFEMEYTFGFVKLQQAIWNTFYFDSHATFKSIILKRPSCDHYNHRLTIEIIIFILFKGSYISI